MRSFVSAFLSALALVATVYPATATAQTVQLQTSDAPHYTGVPIDIQIVAEGFEEEPQPELTFDQPDTGSLSLLRVSPSVSSSIQIVNGRMTQSRQVRFVYLLQYVSQKPGRHRIPAMTLSQGAVEKNIRSLQFDVTEIPLADTQRVGLLLPVETVYVGQPIDVAVEWWGTADTWPNLLNARVDVPLFTRIDEFDFRDDRENESDRKLAVRTAAGFTELPAVDRAARAAGRDFVVRRIERTMVPLRPGEYTLRAPTLTVDQAVRFRRDFFGGRTPTHVRKLRAVGQPRSLVVKPVPAAGRPASFAGAIGQGFALDVAADRTVVQVGDPITLTLTLRGDGTLESATLPPLADAGVDPRRFRAPAENLTGDFDGDAKRFEVTLRVLDDDVREIPPIEYSWFDPSTESFEKVASFPVALSVRPAEVVSADDVVAAEPLAAVAGSQDDERTEPETAKRYTLTGADLSIETDVARLTQGRSAAVSRQGGTFLYRIGLVVVFGALILRRRRSVAPELRERRAKIAALASRVSAAKNGAEVADAVRRAGALSPETDPDERDRLLSELDAQAFAPGGADAAVPDDLRKRARAWLDAVRKAAGAVLLATLAGVAANAHAADALAADALAANALATNALAADAPTLIGDATRAYAQAQDTDDRAERLAAFARAQRLFEGAAKAGADTADLWANAGTAALQAEDLGAAVLSFRRALERDPDHARATRNLAHARNLLPAWLPREDSTGIVDSFFFWRQTLSAAERMEAAAWVFFVGCLLVAARLLNAGAVGRIGAPLAAIVWLGLVGSVVLDGTGGSQGEAAVVTSEAVARAADSKNAPARFPAPLPAGAEVVIVERREGWARIALSGGAEAWVRASALAPLTATSSS